MDYGVQKYIEQHCKDPKFSEIYYQPSAIVGTSQVVTRQFRDQKIKFIYVSKLIIEIRATVVASVIISDGFGRVIFNSVTLTLMTGIFDFEYILPSDRIFFTTNPLGGVAADVSMSFGFQLIEDKAE